MLALASYFIMTARLDLRDHAKYRHPYRSPRKILSIFFAAAAADTAVGYAYHEEAKTTKSRYSQSCHGDYIMKPRAGEIDCVMRLAGPIDTVTGKIEICDAVRGTRHC